MINWRLREAIDEKLREAIGIAEEEYNDPFILIVAHPTIADAVKQTMNPESWDRMRNVKVDGWRIMESEQFVLAVVICGEDVAHLQEGYI